MHWFSRHDSPGVINLVHNFRTYGVVIAFGPDEGGGWRAWISRELVQEESRFEEAPLYPTEKEAKLALLRTVQALVVERECRMVRDMVNLRLELAGDC